MSIDPFTLHVVEYLLVSMVTVIYGVDVVRRGPAPADRCWLPAALAAALASLGHLTALEQTQPVWVGASADGLTVAAVGALWSGSRVVGGRRSLLWLPASTGAAVLALSAATAGHGALGQEIYHLAVAAWALATAAVVLRGPMATHYGGVVSGIALGLCGILLVVRGTAALAVGGGPEAAALALALAPTAASLVVTLAIIAALVGTLLVRRGDSGAMRQPEVLFDPALGVRTPLGLERAAGEVLGRGGALAGAPVVVAIDIEDPVTLLDAYGGRMLEAARELVARVLLDTAPRGALVGTVEAAEQRFVVVLRDSDRARALAWASQVRRDVRASRVQVDAAAVRLTVRTGASSGPGGLDDLVLAAVADSGPDRTAGAGDGRAAGAVSAA